MYCDQCGNQIREGSKFCPHCGAEVKTKLPESETNEAPYEKAQEEKNEREEEDGQEDAWKEEPPKTGNHMAVIAALAVGAVIILAAILFVVFSGKGRSTDTDAVSTSAAVTESQDVEAPKEPGTAETTEAEPQLSAEEQQKKEEAESRFDKLEARSYPGAFASEREMIEQYKSNTKACIAENHFADAQLEMDRWENLLDAINGSGQYEMQVEQVDVSEFPRIKVYVRIQDKTTLVTVDMLKTEGFSVYEQVEGYTEYVKRDILRAVQLNNAESLNIAMVADVSGSMQGSPLLEAKSVMNEFLNSVQTAAGDKVSLISFADEVRIENVFTSDLNAARSAVDRLSAYNKTALYDGLYVAVEQTAAQDGAKCVIAFTDGEDNASNCTPQIVAEKAARYNIPIYIIGVGGDLNNSDLSYIASNTGGFYRNVNAITSMEDVYNEIFREQKEMYVVEYETLQQDDKDVVRSLNLDYVDDVIAVRREYQYVPSIYMEVSVSMAQMFVNDFIIYDSDRRYVTGADLDRLTKEQLRLARNEIYARKGRMFNDQNLQSYFNSRSWYQGSIAPANFNESMFNDYERANAYFIADYERLKGYIR